MIKKMLIITLMISTSYSFSMEDETTRKKARKTEKSKISKRFSDEISRNAIESVRRMQELDGIEQCITTLEKDDGVLTISGNVKKFIRKIQDPKLKKFMIYLNRHGILLQKTLELSSEDPELYADSSDATEETSS